MSVVRGILIGWLGIPSDGSLFFFFFFFASFYFITGFGRPLCLCPFYCAVRMYRCTVVVCGLSCYEWQGLGVRVEKGMGNNRDRDGREKKTKKGEAKRSRKEASFEVARRCGQRAGWLMSYVDYYRLAV